MSSGALPSMRWPLKLIVPAPGRVKPVIVWISVDFPAPFGPTMPTNSPGATVRLTPFTAFRPPKLTLTPLRTRPWAGEPDVARCISEPPRCPAAGTAA